MQALKQRTTQLHRLVRAQALRQVQRLLVRDANLKAVLAGVARASDEAVCAADVDGREHAKVKLAQVQLGERLCVNV